MVNGRYEGGFNRNILGCKAMQWHRRGWLGVIDLIETYWDVKLNTCNIFGFPVLDLIETYWDVKYSIISSSKSSISDLIETYWDVKS